MLITPVFAVLNGVGKRSSVEGSATWELKWYSPDSLYLLGLCATGSDPSSPPSSSFKSNWTQQTISHASHLVRCEFWIDILLLNKVCKQCATHLKRSPGRVSLDHGHIMCVDSKLKSLEHSCGKFMSSKLGSLLFSVLIMLMSPQKVSAFSLLNSFTFRLPTLTTMEKADTCWHSLSEGKRTTEKRDCHPSSHSFL